MKPCKHSPRFWMSDTDECAYCIRDERDRLRGAMHYPECWDTAAYPDLLAAVVEVFQCSNPDCPRQTAPNKKE